MSLSYRTVLVKTSAGEVIECSMALQNFDVLKVDQRGAHGSDLRYQTLELTPAQNERLRVFLEGMMAEEKQLPRPVFAASEGSQLKPINSPFHNATVKRPLIKADLPEEAPEVCQFGGVEHFCMRSPKKNQIYCGHHLRKAARKHADRQRLKRSRSGNSDSWGDEDDEPEPNYDGLAKDANSPQKKALKVGTGNAMPTAIDWDEMVASWERLDQKVPL